MASDGDPGASQAAERHPEPRGARAVAHGGDDRTGNGWHPGVVAAGRLTCTGGDDNGHVPVATTPLTGWLPLPLEELAGVVAVVATTLADLHDRGSVHGCIDVHHIVLDDRGRPLLVEAEAVPATRGRPAGPSPALTPEADVAGLGRVLAGCLGAREGAEEPWADLRSRLASRPVPTWRGRWRRPRSASRSPSADPLREALVRVAREATDPQPSRRPTAAEVASALRDGVPLARLPRREPTGVTPGASGGRRKQAWAMAAGAATSRWLSPARAVVLVAVVSGASALATGLGLRAGARPASPGLPTPAAAPAAAPAPTSVPAPGPVPGTGSGTVPSLVWPTTTTSPLRRCLPVATVLRGDLDGDGCDEALSFDAGLLASAAARLAVGTAGDVVATGDFDCDGRATLALLRPSSGEVFLFDLWAGPGRDVAGRRIGRVEGGVSLEATDLDGDRCDEVVVSRAGGSAHPLDPAP